MTLFKDRLASTIRIKKRFAPSSERLRISRNRVIAVFFLMLAAALMALLFHWLES
jgi:hypothetical protein